jgi:eukaryotic-like serine/threonine-protein kinase
MCLATFGLRGPAGEALPDHRKAVPGGTRLGPYEVVSALSAGGMGQVYRARDTRLDREVAIKLLQAEAASDAARLKRFEKEARAASALNHPNIVTIYAVDRVDSTTFIVMELVEGKTLRDVMADGAGGPLPTRKLLPIAAQIADGLARAHASGIVHRDIKPENVMVTKDGLVKILDFGLAKLAHPERVGGQPVETATVSELTAPGIAMGTVGYMSPEQASGYPVDFRSDQFSFGSVLYELVTGQRPFQGKTAPETLAAIIREDPKPIASLAPASPAALRWILKRCLAKEPKERYASTEDLAKDLQTLQVHLSELSTPSGGAAVMPARPRRAVLAIALAASLVLLAVLAGGLLLGRRTVDVSPPVFKQLTFQRGNVVAGRFTPDGQTIVYAATWNGQPSRIYATRRQGPESAPLPLPDARLRSISPSGELAMILANGTLARAPLSGESPREILENAQWAEWAPDSSNLLVVRGVGGKTRLEYPIGTVLYESTGDIRYPRISPRGDLAAFLDNPNSGDDAGSVAVVDRKGRKRTLASGFISSGGLVWSRDGREVWFTAARNAISNSLIAVSLSGRERVILRTAGPMCILDVAADGSVLLEQHTPTLQTMVLAPGESRERDLSWFDATQAYDLSSDGKTLLFGESGAGAGDRARLFLRPTDGSPPIRLSDGSPGHLSLDGRWAASLLRKPSQQIVLVPTGSGDSTPIPQEGLTPRNVWFFPDGKRLLVLGEESGHGLRFYMRDPAGGPTRPITPEGIRASALRPISPDGEWLLARGPEGSLKVFPVAGGEAKPVAGATAGDRPVQWTSDGRGIYAMERKNDLFLFRVSRIDLETGRRTLWKDIAPSDPAGFIGIPALLIAADERSYVYSYRRTVAELYFVTGLK